jgi:hypothetical protein
MSVPGGAEELKTLAVDESLTRQIATGFANHPHKCICMMRWRQESTLRERETFTHFLEGPNCHVTRQACKITMKLGRLTSSTNPTSYLLRSVALKYFIFLLVQLLAL